MKRIATLTAVLVTVVFALFVLRETADVVALASALHPTFGRVVLWCLVSLYALCLGVPTALVLRLRTPLTAPPSESAEEFGRYLRQLTRQLSRNPHLAGVPVTADRAGVERAVQVLHGRADACITREASLVFVSTAVSQSGRLDGLMVLVAQTRMIWRIAHVYWQRPGLREMGYLYANVGATVFAAQTIEDLDLSEIVEPLVAPVLATVAGGATLVLIPIATLVSESLLQGTVNALLTFRVGCIAKRYCSGLPLPERQAVRRAATSEAVKMLSGVVVGLGKTVSGAFLSGGKRVIKEKGRAGLASLAHAWGITQVINSFRGSGVANEGSGPVESA